VERAKILKHVGWHSFRRTFSTLLNANGEDIKTVQELLRHDGGGRMHGSGLGGR
jgi:site-specific recombinase XerD